MKKAVIGTILVFTVSGCGGGGTSNSPTILQSYEAGETALLRIKPATSNQEYTGIANVKAATELASGSITGLVVTGSSKSGDWYAVNRSGVTSDGGTVTFETIGVNLNSSGSEYVSRNAITTDAGFGFVVTGAPLQQAPSGSHSYTGYTEIVDAGNSPVRETGDVTFNVNFNTGAASVTGATTNYVFSSTNMTVDTLSGNFYTANGKIGRRSGVQLDANIAGAVYGTTGLGVGGVVTSDLDADVGYFGSFAAVR